MPLSYLKAPPPVILPLSRSPPPNSASIKSHEVPAASSAGAHTVKHTDIQLLEVCS